MRRRRKDEEEEETEPQNTYSCTRMKQKRTRREMSSGQEQQTP